MKLARWGNCLRGAGSLMSFFPPPAPRDHRLDMLKRSDEEKLREDWLKIGGDFQRAMYHTAQVMPQHDRTRTPRDS